MSKERADISKERINIVAAIIGGIFICGAAAIGLGLPFVNRIVDLYFLVPTPTAASTSTPVNTETAIVPTLGSGDQFKPSETPSPSSPTNWYVRVYNIDDIGTAYVNDREITTVGYLGDSGWIDVTSYFSPDIQNRIRFTLENKGTGYHWGFAIKKNNFVIWQDEQGAFSQGARNNDQSHPNQIVYDKTLLVSQDEQITEQPTEQP